MRGIESGLYVADDWRVNSKLTLNLGMRWEYYSPYSEVANRWANFDPATDKIMIAGQNGIGPTAGLSSDWKDFAPRFGFAYQALEAYRGARRLRALLQSQRHRRRGAAARPASAVRAGTVHQPGRPDSRAAGQRWLPGHSGCRLERSQQSERQRDRRARNFKQAYAQQFNLTVEHEIAPLRLCSRPPMSAIWDGAWATHLI